jgi:3-oxoisoapionate kinase
MTGLLLTFYGDDFTGSTDVTEALTWNGIPAVLFLEPPAPEFVHAHFPHVRAVGVAGVSRSLKTAELEAVLPDQFAGLAALGAPLFHYKVCSTFDSSPEVGSIGAAAEIGWAQFGPRAVPLLVGAPILKRYVAFGNLFAGVNGVTYRLDRHPTMPKHPVTPMHEADLRVHLSAQSPRRMGLVDWLTIQRGTDAVAGAWAEQVSSGAEIIALDTLSDADLLTLGTFLWELARHGDCPFIVGSSGVEYALAAHWRQAGIAGEAHIPASVPPAERIAVVSGSAAPGTAAQLAWAEANGFRMHRLDTLRLTDESTADAEREAMVVLACAALADGVSPVLFSAWGPDDPAIAATREGLAQRGQDASSISPLLGAQQGRILRDIVARTGIRRVVVTGGDTCGHAAHQLGIYALETILPLAPGAPLCRARAHDAALEGLEISLKAGQVGRADYFGSVLHGRL